MLEELSQLIDYSVHKAVEIERCYFTNQGKTKLLELLKEHQKVLEKIIFIIDNGKEEVVF